MLLDRVLELLCISAICGILWLLMSWIFS